VNKNNKKTMNERTHNSFDVYKEGQNTNSNTNNKNENRTEEFAQELQGNARNERRDDQER
jgi:hypothetical protein